MLADLYAMDYHRSQGYNRRVVMPIGLRDEPLFDAYGRTSGDVVYIDESYQIEPDEGTTYYILAACLVRRENLQPLRESAYDLGEQHGGKWHATELHTTVPGKASLHQMVLLLQNHTRNLIVLKKPLDVTIENFEEVAREDCFRTLFKHLYTNLIIPRDALIVYEKRQLGNPQRKDHHTISLLRKEGVIPSSTRVHAGSPGGEVLLWLPDTLAWAYNRGIYSLRPDLTYIQPLQRSNGYETLNIQS